MTLSKLNKAIAKCNPYNQKELRRYLIGLRRRIEKQNQDDIKSGNIPAMLRVQA